MSETYETILVERRGPVEWITLNRPDRLNAITSTMTEELGGRLDALCGDRSVRVIVLKAAGRGFCAGMDLKSKSEGGTSGGGRYSLPDIVKLMRRCPQPIVTLINGAACGGGFAFALASDIRIAGEAAKMNAAFVNVGLSGCELGTTYFLPRIVGAGIAAELIYTGRFIDAQRAYQLGLVSQVVPNDELDAAGEAFVAEMLRVSPMGLRKGKETLTRAVETPMTLEQALELELATQMECSKGPNFNEAVMAFVEKREPVYVDE